MAIESSVPRAREAQEYLHDRVESLDRLTDRMRDVRTDTDWSELGESTREYDRFATAIAQYLENEAENIDENVAELIGEASKWTSHRDYKSPRINVGMGSRETTQDSESDRYRHKSPKINVGPAFATQPTNSAIDASRVPDSWDGYGLEDDMCDPGFSGEPVFDSPKSFVESQGINLDGEQSYDDVSIDVTYNGASEEDLAFLNAAS